MCIEGKGSQVVGGAELVSCCVDHEWLLLCFGGQVACCGCQIVKLRVCLAAQCMCEQKSKF